jgi:hypothetical protein
LEGIFVQNLKNVPFVILRLWIVPTNKGCSLSPLIGISIENLFLQNPLQKVLDYFFPKNWNWKFSFHIPGYSSVKSKLYTKQLNDKERISAAFENEGIRRALNKCYKKIFR